MNGAKSQFFHLPVHAFLLGLVVFTALPLVQIRLTRLISVFALRPAECI